MKSIDLSSYFRVFWKALPSLKVEGERAGLADLVEDLFRREWEGTFRRGLRALGFLESDSPLPCLALDSLAKNIKDPSKISALRVLLGLPNWMLLRTVVEVFSPAHPYEVIEEWCSHGSLWGDEENSLQDTVLEIGSLVSYISLSKITPLFCYLVSTDLNFQGRELTAGEIKNLAGAILVDQKVARLSDVAIRQYKSRVKKLIEYSEMLLEFCYKFKYQPLDQERLLRLVSPYFERGNLPWQDMAFFQRAHRALIRLGFLGLEKDFGNIPLIQKGLR